MPNLTINLYTLPLWISFVLCLSITAGGLLLVFRYRQSQTHGHFRYLQYFLILVYVHGYYSLWSGIVLSGFLDLDNVEWAIALVTSMGMPFYLIGLSMLITWATRMQERAALPVIGTVAALSLFATFFHVRQDGFTAESVRAACIFSAFFTSLATTAVLLTGNQAIVDRKVLSWLLAVILAGGSLQLTWLTPVRRFLHFESIFVMLFYLFNTALVVVYIYRAPAEEVRPQPSLADFLLRHGISRREADVLAGIYAGKTNQEIANELFISLQTVKDHTSRIYQKTFVKNRAQLTRLVRESAET